MISSVRSTLNNSASPTKFESALGWGGDLNPGKFFNLTLALCNKSLLPRCAAGQIASLMRAVPRISPTWHTLQRGANFRWKSSIQWIWFVASTVKGMPSASGNMIRGIGLKYECFQLQVMRFWVLKTTVPILIQHISMPKLLLHATQVKQVGW
jgi:hypothetical protein